MPQVIVFRLVSIIKHQEKIRNMEEHLSQIKSALEPSIQVETTEAIYVRKYRMVGESLWTKRGTPNASLHAVMDGPTVRLTIVYEIRLLFSLFSANEREQARVR